VVDETAGVVEVLRLSPVAMTSHGLDPTLEGRSVSVCEGAVFGVRRALFLGTQGRFYQSVPLSRCSCLLDGAPQFSDLVDREYRQESEDSVGFGLFGLDQEGTLRLLVHSWDEPEVREDENVARPGHGNEDLVRMPTLRVHVRLEGFPADRCLSPLTCTSTVTALWDSLVNAIPCTPVRDRRIRFVVARGRDNSEGAQTFEGIDVDGLCNILQLNVLHRRMIDLQVALGASEHDWSERLRQFTLVDLPSDPDAGSSVATLAGEFLVVTDGENREGLITHEQEIEIVDPVVGLSIVMVVDLVDRDRIFSHS